MDKLKECAEAYANLLNYEYNISIGRKGKRIDICLIFSKEHFHHLIGLHYLTDRRNLKQNRTNIFDSILSDKLSFQEISSSSLFFYINSRLSLFPHIEDFFDSNGLVFKFNNKEVPGTRMEAEFILENTVDSNIAYVCIDKDNKSDAFFCRSFFPKENIDYTARHIKYTLLYKEKVNIITHEKIIQYDKLSPRDPNK